MGWSRWASATLALVCAACASSSGGGGAGVAGAGAGAGGAQAAGAAGVGGSSGSAPLTWTTVTPAPLARFEANGAVVGGELWVMGGFTSKALDVTQSVDIYDPETDTWRAGPELPAAQTHLAVVALNGDLLVAGGFDGKFAGPRLPTTDAVWRLGVGTSTWSSAPALPYPGAAFSWALVGTELHLAGGLGPDGDHDTGNHYVWDASGADAWTTAADLPSARNHGGGAAVGGIFYALAGRDDWNEKAGDVDAVDAFDPESGAWTARTPIPGARSEIGASTLALDDGRILVVGGSLPGVMPSSDVLAYDPRVDTWSSLTPLPEPRKGALAAQIGRRVVVTTGSPTSTDPSATTFVGCCL
jgi:hypothetical protein